jgi:hypothetical protein
MYDLQWFQEIAVNRAYFLETKKKQLQVSEAAPYVCIIGAPCTRAASMQKTHV